MEQLNFAELIAFVMTVFAMLQSLMIYRSVSSENWRKYLDSSEQAAAKTANKIDDKLVQFQRNVLTPLMERFGAIKATTALADIPAPEAPVITVSQPPVSVEIPHTITRNFDTTDSSFEKTVNSTRRVAHVPTNTSPLFSNRDGAGKEYPYPSVNVNPAYGVQFDIAYIAGAWGFTVLETLVSGVAYKVRLEYTAQVTGDKKDDSSEWLWHELEINGNVTGANQGISNGVSYAEWGITGGDLPVMITPRLRCQWASAADESKVSWQRLIIEPVA